MTRVPTPELDAHLKRIEREADPEARKIDTLTRLGSLIVGKDVENFRAVTCLDAQRELMAWRDRFPMCHYDPDADSIFCDSAPR
jgi:hypothetical protein